MTARIWVFARYLLPTVQKNNKNLLSTVSLLCSATYSTPCWQTKQYLVKKKKTQNKLQIEWNVNLPIEFISFIKPSWNTCDHKLKPWMFLWRASLSAFAEVLMIGWNQSKFITCTVLVPAVLQTVKQIFWGKRWPLIIAFLPCLWRLFSKATVLY